MFRNIAPTHRDVWTFVVIYRVSSAAIPMRLTTACESSRDLQPTAEDKCPSKSHKNAEIPVVGRSHQPQPPIIVNSTKGITDA